MKIQPALYSELQKHCTPSLLSMLTDVVIDEEGENLWDITLVVTNLNAMKIAYVFEQIGGSLIYNGEVSQYVIITQEQDEQIRNGIRLFWINNNANGICPVYDTGVLVIPSILPRFVASETTEGMFIIERLTNGDYVPLRGERYPSMKDAKERARELNNEYADDEMAFK